MLTDEGEPLLLESTKASGSWQCKNTSALNENDTWDLVELPKGRKAIPNK